MDAKRNYRAEAEQMAKSHAEYRDPTLSAELPLIERLLASNPFDSDRELRQAIYYLTDEDYANERHAIIFFASKLI